MQGEKNKREKESERAQRESWLIFLFLPILWILLALLRLTYSHEVMT